MIVSLLPIIRVALSGGGGSDAVKHPATMLFDGQPLRTGPDNGFDILAHAKKTDSGKALAMSEDGKWCFLWSDSGDGWVHITSLLVEGDTNLLPVWPNPIKGYVFKPEGTVTRPTDLKNGPESAYETLVCIPPNQYTKILAKSEDGHWAFIWSDMGDGWVPMSAVKTEANLAWLPTWTLPFKGAMYTPKGTVAAAHLNIHGGPAWDYNIVGKVQQGTNVKILSRNDDSEWMFISGAGESGWVPCAQVKTDGDLAKLSVWSDPMHGASQGA